MAELLFYVLGALSIAGALGVVLSKSPMASVLSLLASFFALAVIYLLAGFQFLAAAQVLVYAGAVLVLFLFVIMLLDLGRTPLTAASGALFASRGARFAAILSVAVAVVLLIAAQTTRFQPPAAVPPEGFDDLEGIAVQLFGRYGLAFEAVSLLLLGTVIAVMLLAKRQRGPWKPAPTPEAARQVPARPAEPRESAPAAALSAGREEARR